MSLPIDRTTKAALDANLVNGNTSDAPVIKSSNDVVYNTIDELNGKVDGLVSSSALSPYPPFFLYRQALINGNFDVWQRGTSFTANASFTADRWKMVWDGTGQVATVSRQDFALGQIDVPNEPKHFLRYQTTTAATGQTYNVIQYKIESVRNFAGKKATLSFWVKTDIARTVSCAINQNFGSGGTPSATVQAAGQSYSSSAVWTKIALVINFPSISGKTLGSNNDDYIDIQISVANNITFTLDIAQAQLTAGDQVLPFQPRSFAEELQLCQRYYEKSFEYGITAVAGSYQKNMAVFVAVGTNYLFGNIKYTVLKRVDPTITCYSYGRTPNKVSPVNGTTDVGTTVTIDTGNANEKGFTKLMDSGTGFTAGGNYWFSWTADSEF